MIPYAVSCGDVTHEDLSILNRATLFMLTLPDQPNLSCHDVCAAWVAAGNPGVHVRGRWCGPFEHSWIELRPRLILDLYPVAGVRPALFCSPPYISPYRPE